MNIYQLQGVIHPRRAQIFEHPFAMRFEHVATGNMASLRAQILMNELLIRVESVDEWDIFDLRNVVRYVTQTELALVAYLTGHAYRVEIVRITCQERGIDVVYGIDIPSIANSRKNSDFGKALIQLKNLCIGGGGVYLQRCMNDLLLSIQYPEDTAFFCYRAIEALKNHAMSMHPHPPKNPGEQWRVFRAMAQCERSDIDFVKHEADSLRHSNKLISIREEREAVLTRTWDIVGEYIKGLINK